MWIEKQHYTHQQNRPFIPHYDCPVKHKSCDLEGSVSFAQWIVDESAVMDVMFTDGALDSLKTIVSGQKQLNFLKSFEECKVTITDVLKADPRSVHFKRKCQDKVYWFHIDELNIAVRFTLDEETKKQIATVFEITQWVETYDGDPDIIGKK